MKRALKAIGGVIPMALLLLWWSWGIRSDYAWADSVTMTKAKEGWSVAWTGSEISLSKPWTWFKTPVTEIAFVNPRKTVLDVSGMVGVEILRAEYDDGKTDESLSQNLIDCGKKRSAPLPEDFKRGDDFEKLKWKDADPEFSGGKILQFVCKSIKESAVRTALGLSEAETARLSELLRHMDTQDYGEDHLNEIHEFFRLKTAALGRKLSESEGSVFIESLRMRADVREQASELALESWNKNEVITTPTFDALVVRLTRSGGDEKNEADAMLYLINTAAEHGKLNDGQQTEVNERVLSYMSRASKTYRINVEAVIKAVQEFVD